MNKDEYVIINKTSIKRRIEELKIWSKHNERLGEYDCEGVIISELNHILFHSKPLALDHIQPLQELVDEGYDPCVSSHHLQIQKMLNVIKDYISSVKFHLDKLVS